MHPGYNASGMTDLGGFAFQKLAFSRVKKILFVRCMKQRNIKTAFGQNRPIFSGLVFGLLCLIFLPSVVTAAAAAVDDTGKKVALPQPARRIITLAPYLTELVYAAGAGQWIVGTVTHSDFPAAAKSLPRIGNYPALDLEAIAALRPDLVLAWKSGSPKAQMEKLHQLGLTIWYSAPQQLQDVAGTLERLGRLAGTEDTAHAAAQDFLQRYQNLKNRYSHRPQLRVFYQLWDKPLMTVSGAQIISDVIRLCGGKNVFADLEVLAPTVTQEAVLTAQPEVIIAGGMPETHGHWWKRWQRWPSVAAVRNQQLYFVPGDLLHRHGPRILDGAEKMCRVIEQARQQKNAKSFN